MCGCRGVEQERTRANGRVDIYYAVTPSHVRTFKASQIDLYNLIPMCICCGCHQRFEDEDKQRKAEMLPIAEKYTREYLGEDVSIEMSKYGPRRYS